MNDFKKVGDLSSGVIGKMKPKIRRTEGEHERELREYFEKKDSEELAIKEKAKSKPKHQNNNPETAFIAAFRKLAIKKGMLVCPVPDPKGNYEYQNYRPFDFVLITKDNVFCIEAKVNHNSLLSHQKGTAAEIEKINSMAYWVIRKHETVKRGTMYSVEKFIDNKMKVICESDVLAHIVQHFEIVKGWKK